jgi:hypothetical protein
MCTLPKTLMEGFFMDRKEIVKALGEHFGVKPKYMRAPSFAYQIEISTDILTIDREGKITTQLGNEVEFGTLINGTIEQEKETVESNTITYEVAVPVEGHTGYTLRNIVNMVYSKQALIKKALGSTNDIVSADWITRINEVPIETLEDFKTAIANIGAEGCAGISFDFTGNTITFKFLEGEVTAEKLEAYTQLIALINQQAKALNHASAKVKLTDNEKYAFRVWLLRLGMIGDEYKMARKILLEKLSGNSAFRSGSKPEKLKEDEAE